MLVTVSLVLSLRMRVLIRTVSAVAESASACRRTAMVGVVHDMVVLAAIKAGSPQELLD